MPNMIVVGILGAAAAAPVLYLAGMAALLRADRKTHSKQVSLSGAR